MKAMDKDGNVYELTMSEGRSVVADTANDKLTDDVNRYSEFRIARQSHLNTEVEKAVINK